MLITEQAVGDIAQLERLIASESGADQRDYYRIALLAIRGLEKLEIAHALGVARSTVEVWAYRYRDGGVDAFKVRPRGFDHGSGRMAQGQDAGGTAQHHDPVPAAVQPGTQPGGAAVGIPAEPLP